MPLLLILTYSTNYNGWGFDEDKHPKLAKTSLEENLTDLTVDLCDDDGSFGRRKFSDEYLKQINTLVHKVSGESDIDVTIEYDHFST